MNKKNLLIISIVVVLIGAVILIKELTRTNNNVSASQANTVQTANTNADFTKLYEKYTNLKKSGKPFLVVFSYEGQCCESTRLLLEKYNKQVKGIIEEYKNKIGSLYIDVEKANAQDNEGLSKIAGENKVAQIPSLLIVDAAGNKKELFSGEFQREKVINILKSLS